jgi:DNA-binding NarL/FixJ family response regulator
VSTYVNDRLSFARSAFPLLARERLTVTGTEDPLQAMRVLVADRDAAMLEALRGAFAGHFQIETATSRAECIALLSERELDVIVACEKLADGPGLALLSHVAGHAPDTLRIFAARTSRLELLKGKLGLFGLFRTLAYPIDARKLMSALMLARAGLDIAPPTLNVRHVVLDEEWTQPGQRARRPRAQPSAPIDVGQEQRTAARAQQPQPAEAQQPGQQRRRPPAPDDDINVEMDMAVTITSVRRVSPPQSADAEPVGSEASRRDDGGPKRLASQAAPQRPLRNPTVSQRVAFQRALARRNSAARKAAGNLGNTPRRNGAGRRGSAAEGAEQSAVMSGRTGRAVRGGANPNSTARTGRATRSGANPGDGTRTGRSRRGGTGAGARSNTAPRGPSAPARNTRVELPDDVPMRALASFARAATERRPVFDPTPSDASDRKTVFIGAGLGAALGALVLALRFLNSGDSVAQSTVATAGTQLVPSLAAQASLSSAGPPGGGLGFAAAPSGSRPAAGRSSSASALAPSPTDPGDDMPPPQLGQPNPLLRPGDPGYEPPPTPPNFEPQFGAEEDTN